MSSLLSIIIPVFQCEKCIEPLYARIKITLEAIKQDWELIFVDDASTDNAWDRIIYLSSRDERIKAIQLAINAGQTAAIAAGLSLAKGDWNLIMDCDLQDSPELIPEFIKLAKPPVEMVFSRYVARSDPFWRRMASRGFFSIMGVLAEDNCTLGTFSLLSGDSRQAYLNSPYAGKAYICQLQRLGLNSVTIPCIKKERTIGKSSYTLKKLMMLTFRVMILYRPILIYQLILLLLTISVSLLVAMQMLTPGVSILIVCFTIFGIFASLMLIRHKLTAKSVIEISKSINVQNT